MGSKKLGVLVQVLRPISELDFVECSQISTPVPLGIPALDSAFHPPQHELGEFIEGSIGILPCP